MMTLFQTKLIPLVALILVGAVGVLAQAPEAKTDERTAQAIFEDANGLLGRRYQEFNKQNLPYDPKVEAQVKKEQHDLAVKNARLLESLSLIHISEPTRLL